ncbi:MFS transporter [Streptomyces sp. NBC_01411]|uniref:MFS transporter n=1 Tax=Streptomyces sp. NBC_01411 TaxID=2903857 RepID=UPI00324BD2DB
MSPDQDSVVGRGDDGGLERDTMNRVVRRLMPLIVICYLVAYIDRSNLSVAALTMNDAIGLTAAQFGLGASLFFATYVVFEVPSNVLLAKLGARRWIARIMISWGIVSGCMALVGGAHSFYLVRLFLGAAEAGFTPGVIWYLTRWFPASHRGRAMGRFYVGAALATVIGSPLSGLVLKMDGVLNTPGWKWLFVVEAVPAVLLGFIVLKSLTDTPEDAAWLPERNRRWLTGRLAQERAEIAGRRSVSVREALTSPGVLLLALFFFLYSFDSIGLTLWMPQVIQGGFGDPSDFVTALLTAVPYALAVVAMVIVARSVDRRGKHALHMAVPMAVSGVLLVASVAAGPGVPGFALLALSTGAAWAAVPALWGSATAFMTGVAAAAGVAFINAFANVAGLAVTPLIGVIKDATGSFDAPLLVIAGAMLLGAVVAIVSGRFTAPGRLAAETAKTTGDGAAPVAVRPEG